MVLQSLLETYLLEACLLSLSQAQMEEHTKATEAGSPQDTHQ